MNASDLLDAALGQLNPLPTGLSAEDERRIALIRQNLPRLLDDGHVFEPPAGLAHRTITLVDAERNGRRPRKHVLEIGPATVPFRWADVAVAAGIFVASLITLIPAIQRGQWRMEQTACAYNLSRLGVSLAQYSGEHGVYPYMDPDSPAPRAGAFAVLLNDAGLLPEPSALECPANGPSSLPRTLPSYTAFCENESKAPRTSPLLHEVDYAYHLGYRRPNTGRPGPIPARLPGQLQSMMPLLADQPGHDDAGRIFRGNSPNHGGAGQNVLCADGSVHWRPTRRISPMDNDMYLNDDNRPAPGVSAHDAVLGPAMNRFDGRN